MKGWIYVATMANTEGMVKIGYSERDPDERVKEWSRATGVPGEGRVEYAAWVNEPKEFEKRIHDRLQEIRQDGKEWFNCDVGFAIDTITNDKEVSNTDILWEDLRRTIDRESHCGNCGHSWNPTSNKTSVSGKPLSLRCPKCGQRK